MYNKEITPESKAREMWEEYDITTDNYGSFFRGLKTHYLIELKIDTLIDITKEVIKTLSRLNHYEVTFWVEVQLCIREIGANQFDKVNSAL
jgi:hypothetical protein